MKLGNLVTKNPALTIDNIINAIFIDKEVIWSISAINGDAMVADRAVVLQKPNTVEQRIVGISWMTAMKPWLKTEAMPNLESMMKASM